MSISDSKDVNIQLITRRQDDVSRHKAYARYLGVMYLMGDASAGVLTHVHQFPVVGDLTPFTVFDIREMNFYSAASIAGLTCTVYLATYEAGDAYYHQWSVGNDTVRPYFSSVILPTHKYRMSSLVGGRSIFQIVFSPNTNGVYIVSRVAGYLYDEREIDQPATPEGTTGLPYSMLEDDKTQAVGQDQLKFYASSSNPFLLADQTTSTYMFGQRTAVFCRRARRYMCGISVE